MLKIGIIGYSFFCMDEVGFYDLRSYFLAKEEAVEYNKLRI